MAIQERLYTVEEFLEIANLPENADKRLELDEGVIVEMPSSSVENTIVAMQIGRLLGNFVYEHEPGYVTGPDGGYRLSGGTMRQPDVAFISKAHLPVAKGRVISHAPDLAIEVISPREDPTVKINEYFASGTQAVWTVYPVEEIIYVWKPTPQGGQYAAYSGNGIIRRR